MSAREAKKKKGKQIPDGGCHPVQNPEKRSLTERQARHLAQRSGLAAEELQELNLGQVHERLRWIFDPQLLFFQRVCGRVVRHDPESGELLPVPFATVHVEDTDCHALFHAPSGSGFMWVFPGICSREVIATAETDECGNFCVWIPRWEIDRVLRWRRERICFPELEPPRIVDLLEDLVPQRPPIPLPRPDPRPLPGPRPGPDPLPDFSDPQVRLAVERRLGPALAQRIEMLAPERSFGEGRQGLDQALLQRAPREILPRSPRVDPEDVPALRTKDERLQRIDLNRPLGPFRTCFDIFVPEWKVVFDVPDLTFRVTQTQEGEEVTVYSEGFFDVRWDGGALDDVTLEAGPNAWTVEVCGEDPEIECEDRDEPAILNVSEMLLTSDYHDNTAGDPTFGYGVRVNQPSSDGVADAVPGPGAGTAHAPYADRLNLYGCFHIGESTHYRVVASFESGPQRPITGVTFPVLTTGFTVDIQAPDEEGWYPIRNDLDSSYEHLILPWPTQQSRFPDGRYELVLQVGSGAPGSRSVDEESDPRTFMVDNSRPTATFHEIRWWHLDDGPSTAEALAEVCPVLPRRSGEDVVVEVRWSASGRHLRSAGAGLSGCGGGAPPVAPGTNASDRKWWWQDPSDDATGMKVARWRIPGSLPAGCYTAALGAVSRAYNPAVPRAATGDDWYVLENRRRVHPRRAISVVDS